MSDEIKLKEHIEHFIKGDIQNSEFKEFNEYSVRKSLMTVDENKQYIYNEMSFQHELGEYLRRFLNGNHGNNRQENPRFMVQYERNISSFGNIKFKSKIRKHEIDIVIIDNIKKENYLIELKYHKSERKRYPNTMFDCVTDIDFVHNVVNAENSNFVKGYCVTIVEDSAFYNPKYKKCGDNLHTNYWCFREVEDKINNFYVKKSESNKETAPINIQEYVETYHYLPVREKFEEGQKGTVWEKIINEDNIKNVENKNAQNARYYIIEIK